jgi:hypothetical protein
MFDISSLDDDDIARLMGLAGMKPSDDRNLNIGILLSLAEERPEILAEFASQKNDATVCVFVCLCLCVCVYVPGFVCLCWLFVYVCLCLREFVRKSAMYSWMQSYPNECTLMFTQPAQPEQVAAARAAGEYFFFFLFCN